MRGATELILKMSNLNNGDGKIHGGRETSLEAHSLNNDGGSVSGAAGTTIRIGREDNPKAITFSNLSGEIGAGGNTILSFLRETVVSALGMIRGLRAFITDHSNSDVFKLQNGTIQTLGSGHARGEYVSIKAKKLYAPGVQILTPRLYARVLDLMLDTQASCERTIIKLPATQGFHLTNPLRTAGTLEFWQDGLYVEDEVQEAMERLYGKDGLLEHRATQTIHLDAEVQAKDLKVYAPTAYLRFGENKLDRSTFTIHLEHGVLRAFVNCFDLEKAALAATNAFVHAPMGIRIGRLVRDLTRDNYVTFYGHKQHRITHNLGSGIKGARG
jgi:adhesin HecA-like repeat protein